MLEHRYVEQLEAIRNTARDQVAMLQGLVAAKEKELIDSGRQNEVIADDEFLPAGYAPPSSAPAPTKGLFYCFIVFVLICFICIAAKKRAVRRKAAADDDDDEFDEDEEEPRPATRKKSKKALEKEQQQQQQQQQQPAHRDAFDGAFFRFLGSFSGLKPSAKAEQLRKVIQTLKPAKVALWENLLESAIPENSVKPGSAVQHQVIWCLFFFFFCLKVKKKENVDFCQCEGCPYRARANNFDLMFGDLDLPQ
jgi:hypothetical protein